MTGRGDEVYAAMDSGVLNPFLPVDVDFLLKVRFILVVNKLHDGLPATFMAKTQISYWEKLKIKSNSIF